ncbi:MAG: hypothetical protein ACKO70_09125 [Actinomycetota bacterium]
MSDDRKRKVKDFWTLHVVLVLVLILCTVATVIEYQRAQEGVGRAWVYTFQWPIIGLFAVVVWNRYRKHGNLTKWFTDRYRKRIEAYRTEAEQTEAQQPQPVDPDELAWRNYVADLQQQERGGELPER